MSASIPNLASDRHAGDAIARASVDGGALEFVDDERAASSHELLIASLRHGARAASTPRALEAGLDRPVVHRLLGGFVRLLDLALDAHAREVGYDNDVYRDDAIATARTTVDDVRLGILTPSEVYERALDDAQDAALALPTDRMGVPALIASSFGAFAALHHIARNSGGPVTGPPAS